MPVFFSLLPPDGSVSRQPRSAARDAVARSPRLGSARDVLRVFIAEDSADCQNRLIHLLEATAVARIEGCAETVQDATREVLELKPDVLVLDLLLRDGSGLDVLRAAAALIPAMRVAVVTNNATEQYRRACKMAGAHAFLDKSLDIDRLPGLLRQWAAERIGDPPANEMN